MNTNSNQTSSTLFAIEFQNIEEKTAKNQPRKNLWLISQKEKMMKK